MNEEYTDVAIYINGTSVYSTKIVGTKSTNICIVAFLSCVLELLSKNLMPKLIADLAIEKQFQGKINLDIV